MGVIIGFAFHGETEQQQHLQEPLHWGKNRVAP
jgi:hypothetical protein